ncbi:MAG TPA: hypothetical protein VFI76_03330 [Terrimicrobiaceae bacterium]|nr:hypothetical protein [Terrimicrobiaceae bacterium]
MKRSGLIIVCLCLLILSGCTTTRSYVFDADNKPIFDFLNDIGNFFTPFDSPYPLG